MADDCFFIAPSVADPDIPQPSCDDTADNEGGSSGDNFSSKSSGVTIYIPSNDNYAVQQNDVKIQEAKILDKTKFFEIIPLPFIQSYGAEIVKTGYRITYNYSYFDPVSGIGGVDTREREEYTSPNEFVFAQGIWGIENYKGSIHVYNKYRDYTFDESTNELTLENTYTTRNYIFPLQDREFLRTDEDYRLSGVKVNSVEENHVTFTIYVCEATGFFDWVTGSFLEYFITVRMRKDYSFLRIENWLSQPSVIGKYSYGDIYDCNYMPEDDEFGDLTDINNRKLQTFATFPVRIGVNWSIFLRKETDILIETLGLREILHPIYGTVEPFMNSDWYLLGYLTPDADAVFRAASYPAVCQESKVYSYLGNNVYQRIQEKRSITFGIIDFAPEKAKTHKLRRREIELLTKVLHTSPADVIGDIPPNVKSEFFTFADTGWSVQEVVQQGNLPFVSIEAPVQDTITDNGAFPIDASIRDVVLNEYELICPTVQERTKVYHSLRPEVIEQSVIDSYFDGPEQDSVVSEATVVENTTIDLYFGTPEETFIPQTFEVPEFTDVKSPLELPEQTQIDTRFETSERTYIRSAFEAPEQTDMNFAPWCPLEDTIFNFKVKDNQLYGYYGITVF